MIGYSLNCVCAIPENVIQLFHLNDSVLLYSSTRMLESLLDHMDEAVKFICNFIENYFKNFQRSKDDMFLLSLKERFCFTKMTEAQLIASLVYIIKIIVLFSKVNSICKSFVDGVLPLIFPQILKYESNETNGITCLLISDIYELLSSEMQEHSIKYLSTFLNAAGTTALIAAKSLKEIIKKQKMLSTVNDIFQLCITNINSTGASLIKALIKHKLLLPTISKELLYSLKYDAKVINRIMKILISKSDIVLT